MEHFNKILIQKAIEAQKLAYAPYSNFAVGAALLTSEERIFSGCNIESASFSTTNCAERTAFFKAISEGEQNFQAIAIVGSKKGGSITDYCPPCGTCLQVMSEFCSPEKFCIILFNGTTTKILKLNELLPYNFKLN